MYRYTNIRYETKIESLKNYTSFYKMLFLVFDLLFFVKDHFLLDDIKFYCYIAKNYISRKYSSISRKYVRCCPVHAYGRQRESGSKSVANSGVK